MDQPPELSTAARALALRCEPRVNELARRMARESFEELPGYAELPDDVKDLEIAATARHGVRLFLRRVAEPHPSPGSHRLFRERAAQRAEEGMPLHLLLRTHALGMYVLWEALREAAGPGDEAALLELVDLLLRSHHTIVGAVAETYLDERSALEAEQRAQRRSLVRGLLDGMLAPGHALLEQLRLEGPALVLAISLDIGPAAAEGPVAVRRRLRRVQTVLDHAFGTEVLALLDAESGRAVVPKGCEPPADLARAVSRACGLEVRIAAVPADDPGAIPDAARTAGRSCASRAPAGCRRGCTASTTSCWSSTSRAPARAATASPPCSTRSPTGPSSSTPSVRTSPSSRTGAPPPSASDCTPIRSTTGSRRSPSRPASTWPRRAAPRW